MAFTSARITGRQKNATHSTRKANAIGFSKRKSRSLKVISGLSDVYAFEQEKTRRANIPLTLDKEELAGAGGESDDEEDPTKKSRPRLVGENDDDEVIGSDEDEEIDSDDAFEESDEDRYAGFNFRQKKSSTTSNKASTSKADRASKNVHFAEVNLDEEVSNGGSNHHVDGSGQDSAGEEEEEEEEEAGEDEEFIDVLDVLDGRGVLDFGDEELAKDGKSSGATAADPASAKKAQEVSRDSSDGEEGSEGVEDEEEEEADGKDEEEAIISGSEDEEADLTAVDALGNFVSGLSTAGAKRKALDEPELVQTSQAKKKRLLKDRTESGVEGEFGARAAGAEKLSLDELLAPLTAQSQSLTSLKKTIKTVASSSNPKNQPLPAPLPQRTQDRLDREAAYEQTKGEVDKWTETMKRIKDAEHLSFPLQAEKHGRVSNLELTAKFKPETELESSIDKLLKSAKLREEDIEKTEELMMNHLSVEEVAARRAELRKMRELAFRADMKAKRVAKIKSKAYRRIHRKEKTKLMEKLDAAGGDDDEEMAEEEILRRETERARERATLRHKNTGKWAKAMRNRGELDEDQRRDINDMLDRGERLRRRIQGEHSDDDGDQDGDDSSDDNNDPNAIDKVKSRAFDELEQLRVNGDSEPPEEPANKTTGVFNMKFMREADARKQRQVGEMIDDFHKGLGDAAAESGDEDTQPTADTGAQGPVERTGGRMIFRPGSGSQQVHALSVQRAPPLSAMSDTSTLKSSEHLLSSPMTERTIQDEPVSPIMPTTTVAAADEPNPWLQVAGQSSSSSKVARKRNEVVVGKDSTFAQKSESTLKKQMAKTAEQKEKEKDDATVEITEAAVLGVASTAAADTKKAEGKKRKKQRTKKKEGSTQSKGAATDKDAPQNNAAGDDDVNSDANSEVEDQERALNRGKGSKAFEQRDLVARAFAGDHVVQEFAELKRKEVDADAPKEVDTTLPGWGSWGGSGTKRAPSKPHLIKKVAGVDPKLRADYAKAHVIISERKDKKAAKYMVKDLPFPYTSKAQFEHSMETPIGTEWNTRVGFQRGTLPRVVKKMGTVIDPLKRLF